MKKILFLSVRNTTIPSGLTTLISDYLKEIVFKLYVKENKEINCIKDLSILINLEEVDHLIIRLIQYFEFFLNFTNMTFEFTKEHNGQFLPDGTLLLKKVV